MLTHPFIIAAVAVAAGVAVLSFVPLPLLGVNDYNVQVQTTLTETCVLGFCEYGVSSVSPHTLGPSTIIDWGGWFGFNLGAPCLNCQYKLTVSFGSYSSSSQESKFISNLFSVNQQDTVTMNFAYVSQGPYTYTANLYLNGGLVATGTTSGCAGPGC